MVLPVPVQAHQSCINHQSHSHANRATFKHLIRPATDICHKTARESDIYPLLLILSRCMWQFDWWGVYASIELLESAWQAKEKADMSWLNKLLCSYIGCWTPWAIRELWLDMCIKDKLQWVKSFN